MKDGDVQKRNDDLLRSYEAKLKHPELTAESYVETVDKIVTWSSNKKAYYPQALGMIIRISEVRKTEVISPIGGFQSSLKSLSPALSKECHQSLRRLLSPNETIRFSAAPFKAQGNRAAVAYCNLIGNIREHFERFSAEQRAHIKNMLFPTVPIQIEQPPALISQISSQSPMMNRIRNPGEQSHVASDSKVTALPAFPPSLPTSSVGYTPTPFSAHHLPDPTPQSSVPAKRGPYVPDSSTTTPTTLTHGNDGATTPPLTSQNGEPPKKKLKISKTTFDLDKKGLQKPSSSAPSIVPTPRQEGMSQQPQDSEQVKATTPAVDGQPIITETDPTSRGDGYDNEGGDDMDIVQDNSRLFELPPPSSYGTSSIAVPLAQGVAQHQHENPFPVEVAGPAVENRGQIHRDENDTMAEPPPPSASVQEDTPLPSPGVVQEEPGEGTGEEMQQKTPNTFLRPFVPKLKLSQFMSQLLCLTSSPRDSPQFPHETTQLSEFISLSSNVPDPLERFITFSLDASTLTRIRKWVELKQQKLDGDLGDCLCVTISCYERQLLDEALAGDGKDKNDNVPPNLSLVGWRSTWSQNNQAHLEAPFEGKRGLFPLCPPLLVTYDGLLDASAFVVEGDNSWKVKGESVDSVLLVRVHPPTKGMIDEWTQACQRKQQIAKQSLGGDFDIDFVPFAVPSGENTSPA